MSDLNDDLIWLAKTVPPDDIYTFALANYEAAEFFFQRFKDQVDILELYKKDELLKMWIDNIVTFRIVKDRKLDVTWHMESHENSD